MNLRTKIILLTIAVALTTALLLILSIRGMVINTFRGELEKRAVSITGNLSDRIANNIPLRDRFQTSKAFREVLDKEEDVEYIFVTNEEGKPFAHTFENGLPPDILSWNPLNKK
jgi:sensor histidine kinase regulating citrate/malate metabolism